MALEVIDITKNGVALNIEVVNLDNREIVNITPSQLAWGILYNNAPIINATASLNDVCIHIGGSIRTIRINFSSDLKRMIRDKNRERNKAEEKKMSAKERLKQEEIKRTVEEYRAREEERKRRMKEMSANYAKPGQLTDEERRNRLRETFRKRAEEKARLNNG